MLFVENRNVYERKELESGGFIINGLCPIEKTEEVKNEADEVIEVINYKFNLEKGEYEVI